MAQDDQQGKRIGAGAPRQAGSVTAEMAVLLPVVLLILLTVAGVAVVGSGQVRVQQAAGALAREHARGDGGRVDVVKVGGRGAAAQVSESGGWTTVTVTRSVPIWQSFGPGIKLRATALVRSEVVQS